MVGVADDLTTLPPVSVPSGLEAGRLWRGWDRAGEQTEDEERTRHEKGQAGKGSLRRRREGPFPTLC